MRRTRGQRHPDIIPCDQALTLPGLFRRRVERTPAAKAYLQYDRTKGRWKSWTWQRAGALARRWQQALAKEGIPAGERVAILLHNSVEWVCFDQAALSLGLVVVPLHTVDAPENIAYILADSGCRLLLTGTIEQWQALEPQRSRFPVLDRVLILQPGSAPVRNHDISFSFVPDWLGRRDAPFETRALEPQALATIVYTSGTTGPPKGVMLSHRNILWDAEAVSRAIPGYREDVYLSFLPLSHAFERTVGYYLPVMNGSCVAFARSVQELEQDLLTIRPTVLIAVPRIFERLYTKLQHQLQQRGALARLLFSWAQRVGWRHFEASQGHASLGLAERLLWPLLRRLVADRLLARLGGRLRVCVSGGAPLYGKISHCLVGLGLPLVQGYGLTEASPVVSGNRLESNLPESVGEPLPGVEIRIGPQDELLVRGPGVMMGYWNQPEETSRAVDAEGWLHTGDQVRMANRHLFILGRIKEILVTSTGEKAAPADLEMAIVQDPLFDMAMVVGEGRPYLAALLRVNRGVWRGFAASLGLDPEDPAALQAPAATAAALERVRRALHGFPAYARVRRVILTLDPWTVADGLLTPTIKLKRSAMERRYEAEIRRLYAGHGLPG